MTNEKWDIRSALKEALKYSKISHFKKNSGSAYRWLLKHNESILFNIFPRKITRAFIEKNLF